VRKANFLAKVKCFDNVLIGLFLNVISMELSSLQLTYAYIWSELDIQHYLNLSNYTCFSLIVVKYNYDFLLFILLPLLVNKDDHNK